MDRVEHFWQLAWEGLGLETPAGLRDKLLDCYAEPHRKYHTGQHLTECFDRLWEVADSVPFLAEVSLGLWFHDAIYSLKGSDNEKRSAQWAFEEICRSGGSPEVANRVRDLILATQHSEVPQSLHAQYLVDIDLSILGADPVRFAEYERQIALEYAFVPSWLFRRKRRSILKGFLARPSLYATPLFQTRFEALARENLARAIGLSK